MADLGLYESPLFFVTVNYLGANIKKLKNVGNRFHEFPRNMIYTWTGLELVRTRYSLGNVSESGGFLVILTKPTKNERDLEPDLVFVAIFFVCQNPYMMVQSPLNRYSAMVFSKRSHHYHHIRILRYLLVGSVNKTTSLTRSSSKVRRGFLTPEEDGYVELVHALRRG